MRASLVLLLLAPAAFAQNRSPEQAPVNAPYVTTPDRIVNAMLKLAGVKKADTVYDLGCGDGRIVISAARQYGAHGVGIEINPERVEEARAKARKAGVDTLVKFDSISMSSVIRAIRSRGPSLSIRTFAASTLF